MAKGETYEEFVAKFKVDHQKTTDDCYTPRAVYETILAWVKKRYNLDSSRPIVRPFYPGGDYRNFDYPENCVVVDNPPFSILSQILRFYTEKKIDFFLFCPALVAFSSRVKCSTVFIGETSRIVYENGANVQTAFKTNLADNIAETAPDLTAALRKVHKTKERPALMRYRYPFSLATASRLRKVADLGEHLVVARGAIVERLDDMPKGKTVYGRGVLLGRADARRMARLLRDTGMGGWGGGLSLALSPREEALQREIDDPESNKEKKTL